MALRDDDPPVVNEPNLASRSDEDLVRLAQAYPGHFGLLYERYAPEINRFYLARVHGDEALAQDLVSQAFTRAYTALPNYVTGSFRGWLYRIARNLLIDTFRRQRPVTSLEGVGSFQANDVPLDEHLIAEEARTQLREALGALGEPGRSILTLRLQGLTGVEIAHRLGMSHEAMKSAQYRAMGKLRIALRHLDGQDKP